MSKRSQKETKPKHIGKEKGRRILPVTRELAPEGAALLEMAPFAVASNGTWLVNVNALDVINPADLKGRKLFVGATLRGDEEQLAQRVLDAAGHDLRARIVGALPAQHRPTQNPAAKEEEEAPIRG